MASVIRTDNAKRPHDKRIALVLQGGGALGAYQAGVYQGLEENGFAPDWVAGNLDRGNQRSDHRGKRAKRARGAARRLLAYGVQRGSAR